MKRGELRQSVEDALISYLDHEIEQRDGMISLQTTRRILHLLRVLESKGETLELGVTFSDVEFHGMLTRIFPPLHLVWRRIRLDEDLQARLYPGTP